MDASMVNEINKAREILETQLNDLLKDFRFKYPGVKIMYFDNLTLDINGDDYLKIGLHVTINGDKESVK